jgi:hypothetical protein
MNDLFEKVPGEYVLNLDGKIAPITGTGAIKADLLQVEVIGLRINSDVL